MRTDVNRSAALIEQNLSIASLPLQEQVAMHAAKVSLMAGPKVTQRPPMRVGQALLAAALWMAFTLNPAFGQAWLIRPSLSLTAEYNDNYDLDIVDPISGFATELTGGLEVNRLTETWQLRGYGQVDEIYYAPSELQNETNLFFGAAGRYTPELQVLGLDASYKRDHLTRTVDLAVSPAGVELAPAGDIDPRARFVNRNIARDRFMVNPSWSREITERARFNLSYTFSDVSYSETQGTGLTDYRNNFIFLGPSYKLTEKDTIRADLGTNLYRASGIDQNYDSYAFVAGIDHQFSEITTGSLALGVQHSSFNTGSDNGNETGPLARASIRRKTETGVLDARVEHWLYPSGSGVRVTDQILLGMEREIIPRLSFTVLARAYRTSFLQDVNRTDERYLSLAPALSWELTETWALEAAYEYIRSKGFDEPEYADSNAVYLTLSYTPLSPFRRLSPFRVR